jgi:hypothetical protein
MLVWLVLVVSMFRERYDDGAEVEGRLSMWTWTGRILAVVVERKDSDAKTIERGISTLIVKW